MSKLSLLFIVSVLFYSCKVKPIITDHDVIRVGSNSREKVDYNYNDKLSDKELDYFAKKLSVEKESIINKNLYIFIKSWEGTTYFKGGSNKNGVDCAGLMQELYKFVYKIKLPRTSTEIYNDKRFTPINKGQELQEGDLVFYNLKEDHPEPHIGIYLKNNRIYSATLADGCIISNIKKGGWKKSYKGALRLKQ